MTLDTLTAISPIDGRIKEGDAVLVTIITDGMETSSCEYSGTAVKELVARLVSNGWSSHVHRFPIT